MKTDLKNIVFTLFIHRKKSLYAWVRVCVQVRKFSICQLSLISESETHILHRFITHRVKYFKPLFLEIDDLQIMKTQRSVSENLNIVKKFNIGKSWCHTLIS